ncbi:MAG: type II toxin-antitoxin system HigB family toxin [Phycisphaerales bacterium]|nr:type II toxin-antitoxin system HigB family toxin [Phycisphaerales bacterium]
MVIRGRKAIDRAMRKHAHVRKPLRQWVELVEAAEWRNIIDARMTWPTADAIKGTAFTCFNIGGNNFRLIAVVSYQRREIVIEEILSHADYSKKY